MRGLLDTSVVIALEEVAAEQLPEEPAVSALTLAERKPRGARAVDLMIAAVALANELPLFTRNPDDFDHLTEIGLDLRRV